ncbi:MAG TPA: MATE family efflux transporter [Flavobacteriales bacterium]|nr:MATE family efflux transporter [Flavobacteriales bacterium]
MSLPKTSSYGHIMRLAMPIIVGGIASNVILATDAFFMARVDEVSLAAVGLAGLFYTTIYILGLGFSTGVQILIARRHGEKKYHAIGAIFDNSLIFLLGMALILWLGMEFLGPPLLKSLVKSPEVYRSAVVYLDNRAWGITFALANLAYRAFFIGVSSTGVIIWSTFAMAISNVILNYGLIFGNFGLPEMGIAGAAVASSLAEIIGLIWFALHAYLGKYHQTFDLFHSWKWQPDVMKTISSIASPVMFQNFVSHAGWFLFFIIIEQSGERALAVSVIIRIIYMFQMVPFWGLSSASNTLVSFTIGEGRYQDVLPLLKRITWLSLALVSPFLLLNLFVPELILGLAVENKNATGLISDSIPTLYVITLALSFFGPAMTWYSGVTGSGNTRTSLLIETITIASYLLLAWFLGIFIKADVHVIWFTEPYYFLVLWFVSWIYMRQGTWKNKKV